MPSDCLFQSENCKLHADITSGFLCWCHQAANGGESKNFLVYWWCHLWVPSARPVGTGLPFLLGQCSNFNQQYWGMEPHHLCGVQTVTTNWTNPGLHLEINSKNLNKSQKAIVKLLDSDWAYGCIMSLHNRDWLMVMHKICSDISKI